MSSMRNVHLMVFIACVIFSAGVFPVYSGAVGNGIYRESAYDALVLSEAAENDDGFIYSLYRRVLSDHNGAVCLFYPTCLDFFRLSIARYGVVPAVLMIIDRIFYRENEASLKVYPNLKDNRYYDPVFHNYILDRQSYYIENGRDR